MLAFGAALASPARAQESGAAALGHAVAGLGVTARVLVIAAHPDDEDTRLIAWLGRGEGVETAYLSLTRGDGGQNLIGRELGEALGVVRTEELLAARRIDGARQYFTRAYDFGFSKSADETFRHWPREELLRDAVTVVRAFRPHIIVSVFTGTPADGHGHHQVAGIIAREVFNAASDTVRFPRAATAGLPGWLPLKLYRSANFRGTPTWRYNAGQYDALLGRSYAELAAESRSQHKSQAFGVLQRKGPVMGAVELLESRAGPPSPQVSTTQDAFFTGFDRSWTRVMAGMKSRNARSFLELAAGMLPAVQRELNLRDPGRSSDRLATYLRLIDSATAAEPSGRATPDVLTSLEIGRQRAERALIASAGIAVEAVAVREQLAQSFLRYADSVKVTVSVYNRSGEFVRLLGGTVGGESGTRGFTFRDSVLLYDSAATYSGYIASQRRTAPQWLGDPRIGDMFQYQVDGISETARPQGPEAAVSLTIAGAPVTVRVPVVFRYADPVRGDVSRPLAVVPPVSVTLDRRVEYAAANAALGRDVRVSVRSAAESAQAVVVTVEAPAGLRVDSSRRTINLPPGASRTLSFRLQGRLTPGRHEVRVAAEAGGRRYDFGWSMIDYDHIRPQRIYQPALLTIQAIDVAVPPTLSVAYIVGAGDNIAPTLEQLGVRLTRLDAASIPATNLSRFDAVVVGTRAYEADPELIANNARLLEYVRNGGTMVVQYGQYEMVRPGMMPYPITLGRPAARVTIEDAPVQILDPTARLLTSPNRITSRDFQGWIQDRSLYMPSSFDDRYTPLLEMNDPGEAPNRGGLLVARYGRGTYIYTTLAFFRQLPAGVPGAARLFVNLLAAGEGTGTTAGEVP